MSTPTPPTGLSATSAIRMVAVREIRTRVLTRAFVIGNAVFLLLIIGSLSVTAALLNPDKPVKIGVVSQAGQLGPALKEAGASLKTKIEIREFTSDAAARQALLDGKVKIALSGGGTGYVARADKNINPTLRAVLTSAVQQSAVAGALVKQGVDPAALSKAAASARLDLRFEHPPKKDADQRTAVAFAVIALLYLQLVGNGTAVATAVVEEKTTRVVELLLAAIKPVHLLAGKVLGIGTVGLLQLAAYGVVALTAGAGSGLLALNAPVLVTFLSALGWYVLGYLFLGVLYAAAGSLVSRQEEIASATAPLTVLVLGMFIVAQVSVADPSGHLSNVMSWIPPFSAILMPLRIAAGVTGPLQIIVTSSLMLVTSSLLALGAGRIYQTSILRTGTTFPWRRKRRAKAAVA